MQQVLKAAGCALEDCTKISMFLTHMEDAAIVVRATLHVMCKATRLFATLPSAILRELLKRFLEGGGGVTFSSQ